jgi:hypothetical protein
VPDEYRARADDEYGTPTPEACRANAADCLRMMQLATVAEVRAALLLMAQSWNKLANRLEQATQSADELPASGAGT